ncbi:MAG: L-2-hydroxyglutarate oxidase [Chloroflexota bacterium]|nr:MAG: L-2-hydroxyglutarate oxidase [Chloroflexota bacterium]
MATEVLDVTENSYDVVIVGAGIVGLATALMLTKRCPSCRLAVLEKERSVGRHQTGHNSGVIHAGLYYKPGSLKAKMCVEGGRRLIDFCDAHDIRYERCGKVVVATDESELAGLEELHGRGTANGVPGLRCITSGDLRDIEPHASGIAALYSPSTGIVDYGRVAEAMANDLRGRGVDLLTGHRVLAVRENDRGLMVRTEPAVLHTSYLINCGGLYSDVLARQMGVNSDVCIVPFRGEYYFLRPERQGLVRGLIYPVPDPDLPFLGVHFTRSIHGRVEAGPNAVLALAREGYTRSSLDAGELFQTLAYRGFWRLSRRYWRTGLDEFKRSCSKEIFAASLRRLVPEVQASDLMPGGAGVRAQAIDSTGKLLDDFVIAESSRAIHVLNAPSPGATASLAIGDHIAEIAAERFGLA